MKRIVLSGLLALIAACGGSDAGGDTNITKKVQVEDEKAAACSEEIEMECDEGLVDACSLTPATSTVHACVAEPVTDEVVPTEDDPEEAETEEAPVTEE